MIRRLPDPATLRAAIWTARAARSARRQIARGEALDPIALPRVPSLRPSAGRGVAAVLRRGCYSCLVRALVRQRWYAARGERRDVVIGVSPPARGFEAHAWLEGEAPCHGTTFTELWRR